MKGNKYMIQTLLLSELENIMNDTICPRGRKGAYSLKASTSKYDVKKEKDSIVFRAEAMGLKKSDIEMSVKNKHLVVKSKTEGKDLFASRIDCSVYVGDDVSLPDSTAELDFGVLTITLPIKENKLDTTINFS
tara:strand:+ start:1096 stop:1494 length:399 start_codon:yes stop_codon:yes gene_type:complete